MIKKRLGVFCIALSILLNILGVSPFLTVAHAENQYITADWISGGGVYFDTETGVISQADKTITSIYVPSVINGVVVTAVDDYAFWSCENLTTVSFSSGITTIGDRAFASCKNLSLISIPSTVTTIGTSAFFECTSLKSIEIPKSVTTIGFSAFSGCSNLTSITLPSGISEISSSLFSNCVNLTSVTINGDLKKINYEAFSNCPKLANIYFTGTQAQWNNVSVGSRNTDLDNASISYNVANSENNINYTYSNILNSAPETLVSSIKTAIESVKSGTISAIYDLSESLYYVVMTSSGETNGVFVKTVLKDGEYAYDLGEFSTVLATQSELNGFVNQYLTTSNISLDFEKIPLLASSSDATISSYLKNALDNISGIKINDVAKSEITNFVETAVTQQSAFSMECQDNHLVVDSSLVQNSLQIASQTKSDVENSLANLGETLNKNIGINTIIVAQNTMLDKENDVRITINSDMKNILNNAYMQILLEDGKYGLSVTGENLNAILEKYNSITFKLSISESDIYLCQFLDEDGNVIDQMIAPVTVMLPTSNQFATIIASFSESEENWGGQFDAINNVISFHTSYTGKYMIVDNSVEIMDIDDKYRAELLFMASKGFFDLDISGNFRPDESLTRYDATKALVKMFFALDTTYETSFLDVPVTSEYYSYVASAEAWNIVAGYNTGEFAGDRHITTQQVLVLIARTLVDKKGYVTPENSEDYFNWVFGAENSEYWAELETALAIREGVVLAGEVLDPLSPITRQDAAVYLYRLFMLLEEVNTTTFGLLTSDTSNNLNAGGELIPETTNQPISSTGTVLIIGLPITFAAIAIAIAIYLVQKRLEEIRLLKEYEEKEREKAEKAKAREEANQFKFKR